jgi:ribosomal protein S18 acetylase RimI-like enzyme
MSLLIRSATVADVEWLATLNSSVQLLHWTHEPSRFKQPDASAIASWFTARIQEPIARVWIAEVDGVAVGFVCVEQHDRPENPFSYARRMHEIVNIAILPQWHGQGIGTTLLQKAIDEARANGIGEVELSCWAFNERAQRAFKKFGFTPRWLRFGLRVS